MKLVPIAGGARHQQGRSFFSATQGPQRNFKEMLAEEVSDSKGATGNNAPEPAHGACTPANQPQLIRRIESLLDGLDNYRSKLAGNRIPVADLQAHSRALQTECNCLKAALPPAAEGNGLEAILEDAARSIAGEIQRLSRGEYSTWGMTAKEAIRS
jgi:hypothetical protein